MSCGGPYEVKSEYKDITAPDWRVTRVQSPEVIWARYADALGLDELRSTFGDHWPPKSARLGEEVYAWRDANMSPRPLDPKDHPAAWMSLYNDPLDPGDVYMSRGVWPDQHGRGLGRLMRAYAEDWCRRLGEVKMGEARATLNIFVSATNWRHLSQVMRDKYWTLDAVLLGEDPQFGFHHEVVAPPDPLEKAAADLLEDVRRRYPGEELTCPYMRALDDAVRGRES